jgi:hypothetical protein
MSIPYQYGCCVSIGAAKVKPNGWHHDTPNVEDAGPSSTPASWSGSGPSAQRSNRPRRQRNRGSAPKGRERKEGSGECPRSPRSRSAIRGVPPCDPTVFCRHACARNGKNATTLRRPGRRDVNESRVPRGADNPAFTHFLSYACRLHRRHRTEKSGPGTAEYLYGIDIPPPVVRTLPMSAGSRNGASSGMRFCASEERTP